MVQDSYNDSPTLYLISTPIGNLEDITYRSIRILNEVDVIFSEDTRVTINLLTHYGISKKLISLHEHNEEIVKERVLKFLENGDSVALVTDRGTPIISDPGYKTVKYVSDNGFNVVALPGATAFVPALITSGISPQPFLFYGFLDSKESSRKKELELLSDYEETMIFYEAPHKLSATLIDMYNTFGDREISIVRELTKIHEEVIKTSLESAKEKYQTEGIKGEIVLIVAGAKEEKNEFTLEDAIKIAKEQMSDGMSLNESAKFAAKETGIKKNLIYKELTEN